eukprot:5645740-Prymnesium_polylepis.1
MHHQPRQAHSERLWHTCTSRPTKRRTISLQKLCLHGHTYTCTFDHARRLPAGRRRGAAARAVAALRRAVRRLRQLRRSAVPLHTARGRQRPVGDARAHRHSGCAGCGARARLHAAAGHASTHAEAVAQHGLHVRRQPHARRLRRPGVPQQQRRARRDAARRQGAAVAAGVGQAAPRALGRPGRLRLRRRAPHRAVGPARSPPRSRLHVRIRRQGEHGAARRPRPPLLARQPVP